MLSCAKLTLLVARTQSDILSMALGRRRGLLRLYRQPRVSSLNAGLLLAMGGTGLLYSRRALRLKRTGSPRRAGSHELLLRRELPRLELLTGSRLRGPVRPTGWPYAKLLPGKRQLSWGGMPWRKLSPDR